MVKTIRSLAKGLQVLEFVAAQGGATVRAVAQALDVPEATAARLLETLKLEGYLHRTRTRGTYWATARIPALAAKTPLRPLLIHAAGEHLDAVSDALNVSTMICADNGERMEVLRGNANKPTFVVTRFVPGYTFPYQRDPSGLTYLAFRPQAERDRALSLRPTNPRAVTAPLAALESRVSEIQAAGYAIALDSYDGRELCLSVPIVLNGVAEACIEVRGMQSRIARRSMENHHLPVVRRACAALADQVASLFNRAIEKG